VGGSLGLLRFSSLVRCYLNARWGHCEPSTERGREAVPSPRSKCCPRGLRQDSSAATRRKVISHPCALTASATTAHRRPGNWGSLPLGPYHSSPAARGRGPHAIPPWLAVAALSVTRSLIRRRFSPLTLLIATLPGSMKAASLLALLIAPTGLSLALAPSLRSTRRAAVDLSSVTEAADLHQHPAPGTTKQTVSLDCLATPAYACRLVRRRTASLGSTTRHCSYLSPGRTSVKATFAAVQ
jgi:hypothetical protein